MAGGCRLISWMYRFDVQLEQWRGCGAPASWLRGGLGTLACWWPPGHRSWQEPGVAAGRCPARTMTGLRCPGILAPGRPWHAGVPVATRSPVLAVAAQGAGSIDLISRSGASRTQHPAGMPLQLPHWQVSWASVRPCPSPTILWCSGLGKALVCWRAGGRSCATALVDAPGYIRSCLTSIVVPKPSVRS